MTKSMLLAAALLALPAAAGAGTLGTIPVDPNKIVTGTFGAPGTQTWRLYLSRGKYYAVSGTALANQILATVAVRAAGGKLLRSFRFDEFSGADEGPRGVSLRAPYTGWYTVAVTVAPGDLGEPDARYGLIAAHDCPGDATTSCAIAVGQTLNNLHVDYVTDADTFRTSLRGGVSYTFSLASRSVPYCASLYIVGPGGFAVSGVGDTPLVFTATKSGAYYMSEKPDNCEGFYDSWYSLSLAPSS